MCVQSVDHHSTGPLGPWAKAAPADNSDLDKDKEDMGPRPAASQHHDHLVDAPTP